MSSKSSSTRWRASSPSTRGRFAQVFSAFALLGVAAGLFAAARSPLFLVQVVEIADLPDDAPIDAQELTRLANIPVGHANLFALDLSEVQRRILANPWVREVRLQKKFPQTLTIAASFRKPRALLQTPQGVLSYVDAEGTAFGRATTFQGGIPILTGITDPSRARAAVKLLDAWNGRMGESHAEISSLSWDSERGFRAMVVYPLGKRVEGELARQRVHEGELARRRAYDIGARARTFVDLGQDFDASTAPQMDRLASVLAYLREKSIPARQIWADSGKKIVVRTVRGS